MTPLDHYKNVAHDLLGFPVPGIPDIPQPTYKTTLPPFIQKLPSLAEEDAEYLTAKGVFSLPDERLQNELLRTFVLHVHPYLPVLDLPPFLQAIADNNGHSSVSMLLMYAVMFSAIAFVDPTHIQRAGYTSRKAARQEFFRKARVSQVHIPQDHNHLLTYSQVLYDFDVESDRIVLIQTVLLMTYWHENQDDPKDFRHWLEIALSQAALAMPIKEQEQRTRASTFTSPGLWKRLWWCMYTRDRLNALNLRRSPVIKDAEFTVPLPTLSDFDMGTYPPSVLAMPILGACEVLRSPMQQQHLATMFIEKARLCCTISGIIFPITNAAVFAPAVFTHYIAALDDWHASLPKEVQYHSPPERKSLSEGERALFAYRAWLEMIYLAASGALHRQNQAQSQKSVQSESNLNPNPTNPSGDGIHSVTQSIAGVADGLNQLDLVHCLPTTTVGLLTPVLATHFMNIRSETPDLWRNAFQSLYQCLKVLEKLGEVYELAESMAGFFQAAICGDANVNSNTNAESNREGRETAFLQRTLTADELDGFARLVGGRTGLQNCR